MARKTAKCFAKDSAAGTEVGVDLRRLDVFQAYDTFKF